MSTIQQNLTRLQTAKSDISTAITTMGGVVTAGDGFEDFPSDILTIPSGGSIEGTITSTGTYQLTVYYAVRSDDYIICKWLQPYEASYYYISGLLNDGETITIDFLSYYYYDTTDREYIFWNGYNSYSVSNNIISIQAPQNYGKRYMLVAKVISSS